MILKKIHRWEGDTPFDKYEARDRRVVDEQHINELLNWLEYEQTSGYQATRNSCKQEQYWAHLLRNILFDKMFSNFIFNKRNNKFRVRCDTCDRIIMGSFEVNKKLPIGNIKIELDMICDCAERRIHDLEYHLEYLLRGD